MKSLSLESIKWKPFYIEDVAEIDSGIDIYEKERIYGDVPYVTATASNNGIGYFVRNNNVTLEDGCLSVNRNGSVGYCFYHPYAALFGNDTRKLRPKVKNKYTSLFLSICITKQKDKYGYGYKMGTGRLRRQRILLPVDDSNEPDWHFMEEYMRFKERQILSMIADKLRTRIRLCEPTAAVSSPSNWKVFKITDIFSEIKRGKRFKKAEHADGCFPYVSSTALNNGVDGFIRYHDSVRKFSDCLTLANSGSVGIAFYHQYDFIASDHVTQLKRPGIDKYAYLFLATILRRLSEKYGFNREINDARIRREQLLLPVKENGELDVDFMSSYMRQKEFAQLLSTYANIMARL